MNKKIAALLIILIPALLFLSVWQSYRYDMLNRDVSKLEQAQKDVFERNKKIVMGIEFLKSPFRINKIAEEDLEMKKAQPEQIIHIEVDNSGDGYDG